MHNCTVLSSNKIGNVIKCPSCKELVIGLGTVIIKFEPEQSVIFLKALQSSIDSCADPSKKIFLKTPVNNLMIALNQKELKESIELIEMALLQLEISKLLHEAGV